MKIFLSLAILLLAFTFCSAQTTKSFEVLKRQANKAKNKHIAKYDKFDEYTVVAALPYDLIGITERLTNTFFGDYGVRALWFGSGFTYTGKDLEQGKEKYFLFFSAQSVKPQFLRNSQLVVLVDDKRYRLTPADRDIELERYYGESLGFVIDKEILQEMATANDSELKVGEYVQVLKKRHKEMLADTLKIADISISETK